MTKEIMKTDDRELYIRLVLFIKDDHKHIQELVDSFGVESMYAGREPTLSEALWICYQAEEKLKEMGLDSNYTYNLYLDIERGLELYPDSIFNLVHAHPIPRARAILMTIGEDDDKT